MDPNTSEEVDSNGEESKCEIWVNQIKTFIKLG